MVAGLAGLTGRRKKVSYRLGAYEYEAAVVSQLSPSLFTGTPSLQHLQIHRFRDCGPGCVTHAGATSEGDKHDLEDNLPAYSHESQGDHDKGAAHREHLGAPSAKATAVSGEMVSCLMSVIWNACTCEDVHASV